MEPDTTMTEYVKGFEAGCDFIVNEIKLMQRKYGDQVPLSTLLEHLLQEKKNG